MEVLVYPNTETAVPFVNLMSPGSLTPEEAAALYLDPLGIDYAVIDDSLIPPSPYISEAMTVSIVNPCCPEFSWYLPLAQSIATKYNANYWQQQYNVGLFDLEYYNPYQLSLACATPENERNADQTAAVEFAVGINQLQAQIQLQIDSATSGEEIITILNQLG